MSKAGAKNYNIIVWGFLALSFFYLLIGHQFSLTRSLYDEGLSVYGAARILNGDIPYRDFWTLYAPGQFYLLAGLFKLIGPSIVAERVLTVVILALSAFCIYLLSCRLVPPNFALLTWLLTLGWFKKWTAYSYSYPAQPALLFSILSCLSLANFLHGEKKRWLILSGLCTGLVTLFRQDFGFYTFAATALVIFVWAYVNLYKEGKALRISIARALNIILQHCAGLIVIILPALFYFFSKGTLANLFSDLILFPIKVYPKVRHLPFPGLSFNTAIFYFPLLIFSLAAFKIIFQLRLRSLWTQRDWLILLCLLLGGALLNHLRLRAEIRHLFAVTVPAIILLVYLVFDFLQKHLFKKAAYYRTAIWAAAFLAAIPLLVNSILFDGRLLTYTSLGWPSQLSRSRGCYDYSDFAMSQQQAIKYIQEHVATHEKIFVGNFRHDRIIFNDIMFYFLSERDSATMYHELHPGLVTTAEVQRHIIDEINNNHVRYIVLWAGNEGLWEPNESSRSSGEVALDEFIRQNYRHIQTLGPYAILYRPL